eukprot:366130-Chlamydomonas_euryale.AAC.34
MMGSTALERLLRVKRDWLKARARDGSCKAGLVAVETSREHDRTVDDVLWVVIEGELATVVIIDVDEMGAQFTEVGEVLLHGSVVWRDEVFKYDDETVGKLLRSMQQFAALDYTLQTAPPQGGVLRHPRPSWVRFPGLSWYVPTHPSASHAATSQYSYNCRLASHLVPWMALPAGWLFDMSLVGNC